MNEQKQIEEMAVLLAKSYCRECGCENCGCAEEYGKKEECSDYVQYKMMATKLYGIVIPENAVVLTREEYERLLKEETLCERLGSDIDVKLKYIYELEDKVAQVRKETAEKIMNEISGDILTISTRDYGSIEVIPMERLQEICNNIIERN